MNITFYKVRRKDSPKLFYNPNKPGNRVDPTFDEEGKRYYQLGHARNAVDFCKQPINNHWRPQTQKTPVETEIIEYLETTKEISVVSS
jgi:hypothetical protein